MSSLATESSMTSKLFIENYKILQDAPENKDKTDGVKSKKNGEEKIITKNPKTEKKS